MPNNVLIKIDILCFNKLMHVLYSMLSNNVKKTLAYVHLLLRQLMHPISYVFCTTLHIYIYI